MVRHPSIPSSEVCHGDPDSKTKRTAFEVMSKRRRGYPERGARQAGPESRFTPTRSSLRSSAATTFARAAAGVCSRMLPEHGLLSTASREIINERLIDHLDFFRAQAEVKTSRSACMWSASVVPVRGTMPISRANRKTTWLTVGRGARRCAPGRRRPMSFGWQSTARSPDRPVRSRRRTCRTSRSQPCAA